MRCPNRNSWRWSAVEMLAGRRSPSCPGSSMECLRKSALALLSLLSVSGIVAVVSASSPLQVAMCVRELDLTTQLVSERMRMSFTGSPESGDASQVFVGLPKELVPYVSFYDAHQVSGEDLIPIGMAPADASSTVGVDQPPEGVVLFAIRLAHPIEDKSTDSEKKDPTTVEIKFVYNGAMTPLPKEIEQLEDQKILFEHQLFAMLPYPVIVQSLRVNLPSRQVETYTKVEPALFSERDKAISYGPYEDVPPYKSEPLRLHFRSNIPFLALVNVVREIQVSLWGHVTVEERVEFEHAGAKLKGSFSRLEYMKGTAMLGDPSSGGPASFAEITEQIPLTAHTLYYRDAIGNVSTSQYVHKNDALLVQLGNRFPMFGGWKSSHIFGYSLPIESVVSRSGKSGRLSLNMMFTPGIYAPIRNLEVRVVLPEGAANIETSVPFEVAEFSDIKKTYLDTVGRPVIVLHKSNVVPDHNRPFTVDFTVSTLSQLREPLLLISFFFIFYVVMMAFARLSEVSLGKSSKEE